MHEALEGYYPWHLHAKLAALLNKTPEALGDDFIEKISGILFSLEAGLPRFAEEWQNSNGTSSKLLLKHVRTLKMSLENLKPATWAALAEAMFTQFGPSLTDAEARESFGGGTPEEHGYKHISEWILQLQSVEQAIDSIPDVPGRKGRPSKDHIRQAVEGLHRIWLRITNTKPTHSYTPETGTVGRFLSFCELALSPVLGTNISLEHYVRAVTYGEK
jgi:hypothetical protein